MRIRVMDTETTGTDHTKDKLVEVAGVNLGLNAIEWEIMGGFTSLADPGFPIPLEAMATHHITDEEVVGAPKPEAAVTLMGMELGAADYYVAHNAAFDRGFLSMIDSSYGSPQQWICTWRAAMHLLPDAPGHSNQVLRYYFKIKPDMSLFEGMDPAALAPHRALFDSVVTAGILIELLKMRSPEELSKLSRMPVLLKTCRFGKHKGMLWKDVPKDYLQWVLRQSDMDADARHTANHYLHNQGSLL